MQIITTIAEFRAVRAAVHGALGLVPTMGFLHEGHLSLVERALSANAQVAVSIFVNPTQFGPNEDFSRYPRDTDRDLALLRKEGVQWVFMPTVEEMYPQGFQTYVEVTGVSQGLEGERRPGHFRGVATVVTKLFNIVQPDRAYFGQKDAQQVAVIRRMVADLAMPLEIVVVPTMRADDGLALSSRNTYLSEEQRSAAPIVYRALMAAHARYTAGDREPEHLRAAMLTTLHTEPLAKVEYVSAADADSLEELTASSVRPILLSLAVRFGRTRLIDNLVLSQSKN
ncbi:MAG: pantoate--beta-alanine ligase [Anaerolineae bacterium]|nr:pantoate--beta-alanine ligase [Anaerolineae bacterium]